MGKQTFRSFVNLAGCCALNGHLRSFADMELRSDIFIHHPMSRVDELIPRNWKTLFSASLSERNRNGAPEFGSPLNSSRKRHLFLFAAIRLSDSRYDGILLRLRDQSHIHTDNPELPGPPAGPQ